MTTPRIEKSTRYQLGVTMLEVLIAIVVLTIGLLGVASMLMKTHVAEAEAYQRAQAVILLQTITERIEANRKNAMAYVTTTPVGTGNDVRDCTGLTGADLDLCEWNNALLGAGENSGGRQVGALMGGRGCITNTAPAMPRQFVVAVVWQGMTATAAPSVDCGTGLYGDESKRRAVIGHITVGCLQNDPTTGACVTP